MKRAIIIRYGAIGDVIITTPLIRLLHGDGYKVDYEGKHAAEAILRNNPHLNRFILHKHMDTDEALDQHVVQMCAKYDRAIVLNKTIERDIALVPWQKEYHKSKAERHELCNVNFYDHTMRKAGYEDHIGLTGEMYFTSYEKERAQKWKYRYKDKFIILWGLSGSAVHKGWPYTEHAAKAFLEAHEDVVIFTVGNDLDELIEWKHDRVVNKCGKWKIRESILFANYADLVIGTDTGFMHGAGMWDTAKVLLLSANTEEKISKYWRNTMTVTSDADCFPCHKIHYGLETCSLDKELRLPKCMVEIGPARVLNILEDHYQDWRKENGIVQGDRRQGSVHRGRRDGMELGAQGSVSGQQLGGVLQSCAST